jgi:hypothetical protein
MKMEQTECSEKLAYKIQTPGNYSEESIQLLHNILNYSKSFYGRHIVLYSGSLDTNWSKLGRECVLSQLWPVRRIISPLHSARET